MYSAAAPAMPLISPRRFNTPHHATPRTHLLSNGRYAVMLTAHRKGACVVAVFTRDVAESKATRATDAGRAKGYPLMFTTEPEE